MKNRLLAAVILLLTVPFIAYAHVKWFVEFDTTKEPESLYAIIREPQIWWLTGLSIVIIYITSWLDREWLSPVDRPEWQDKLSILQSFVPDLMRYGTGLFFLGLSAAFPYIMLTPELVTDNPMLRYIHIIIGVTAFHRRSSFVAGLGILFLYSYAVQLYGTFHMLDYLVFVGTAFYLILQSVRPKGETGQEIELVRLVLCYSFLWGAIEKFMQPDLFFQLLKEHPYLAMGMDWEFFVRGCGFVEFCCAWHILTGKLAGYAASALMAFFVVAALIPFGLIDFVGHFLFIVPLLAILFTPRRTLPIASALGSTIVFTATLVFLTLFAYASYYVLHYQLHPNLF